MSNPIPVVTRHLVCCVVLLGALLLGAAPAHGARAVPERVVTIPGVDAAGDDRLDRVRVLRQGSASARRILVLEPGSATGAASLRLLGADLVRRLPGWQVWSVDRRENLLEDDRGLREALRGRRDARGLYDFYLGWQADPAITDHVAVPPAPVQAAARSWGMAVAVQDLRRVVRVARRAGSTVVLGGHSLGATIATAYATWDFGGRAGARDLDGLVLIDGASGAGVAPSAAQAGAAKAAIDAGGPFVDLLGTSAPWTAGLLTTVGSVLALRDGDSPSLVQSWPLLPSTLRAPVPLTNRGALGALLDVGDGRTPLPLFGVHAGSPTAEGGWQDGSRTTLDRVAQALAGLPGMDGTTWFALRRLALDASAVNGGVATPAQAVLGIRTTRARDARIPLFAFETALGRRRVLRAARQLAAVARLPRRAHVLVDRSATDAHLDPLVALPARNDLLRTLAGFLRAKV